MDSQEYTIFSLANQYNFFNKIESQTSAISRVFNKENFQNTPVELNWYYEQKVNPSTSKPSIEFASDYQVRQSADMDIVEASLTNQTCSLQCIEAMTRLATCVQTPSRSLVLMAGWPDKPITPGAIAAPEMNKEKSGIDMTGLILSEALPLADTTEQKPSDLGHADRLMGLSFTCAYLIRYAYRLPGENWELKINDFKAKYSDMLGRDHSGIVPSNAWANSFNTLAKDLKHKMRIIVFMTIVTSTGLSSLSADQGKMFRYLFATPFAFYGQAVLIQIRKCAEVLDLDVSSFASALTVTELQTGMGIIQKSLAEATSLVYWPYARAFDDSFLSSMSSIAVKKVHLVCLGILNMKGGQSRLIPIHNVKSVAIVRDREILMEVAAKIVAAIDESRPETMTSKVLKSMELNPRFNQRAQTYLSSLQAASSPNVINQVPTGLDLQGLIRQ